ncbi:MAG: hemolysin, partial [Duncaniella sp.]|nr:hemolysin [Duncaniella sp.]
MDIKPEVTPPVKRTVLDYEDIIEMAPFLKGKRGLVEFLMKALDIDKVNRIHDHNFDTPGPQFCRGLLDDLDIKLRIDNEQLLDNLPDGPFITVSNHPFGALDGITLIDLIGSRRPEFKVMVNMILNYIVAMRPNFIAVDQAASDDPAKKAVSMRGIKEAIMQVKKGHPIGFFTAGSVGIYNRHHRFEARE